MSSVELTLDTQDIHFVLNEWLHIDHLTQYPKYKDFDAETIELLVQEGHEFAKEVIAPHKVESEREGCKIVDGRAVVPQCLHAPFQKAFELGWATLKANPHYGGQGAPLTVRLAVNEGMIAANLGLSLHFGLNEGVSAIIEIFGTEEQKQKYIPKLLKGVYTSCMCLSEPHSGSDVGANSTAAEFVEDGRYKIQGTKSWISGGDNDFGKNVIHVVLARIKGAIPGTKGLSLFLVPMFHVNEDGTLGEHNDVSLVSIEHKMGLKSMTTCVMNYGENDQCYGFLLGEEHQGIAHMFKLVNETRLGVASIGLSLPSAAYQNALAYAKERLQGSHINRMKDPTAPSVPIIEHPDVQLNLMNMKARVEAIRALLYAVHEMADRRAATEDPKEREECSDLIEILTPMCKGWAAEVGIDVVRIGIQVLGGVGYTQDFPLEQFYRDIRVIAIYEGTTGIQALDLVGRKMVMRNGALFMKLLGCFNQFSEEQKSHPLLSETVQRWVSHYERVAELALGMQSLGSERGMEGGVLYATPFMMYLSAITAGYFYLKQGIVAAEKLERLKSENHVKPTQTKEFLKKNSSARFYENKLKTIHFYIRIVLPVAQGNTAGIKEKNFEALDVDWD